MTEITMQFSDEQKELLERYAKRRGIDTETAIKKALLEMVAETEQVKPRHRWSSMSKILRLRGR